jgi:tetratricopeptide (TPR) repeat protein
MLPLSMRFTLQSLLVVSSLPIPRVRPASRVLKGYPCHTWSIYFALCQGFDPLCDLDPFARNAVAVDCKRSPDARDQEQYEEAEALYQRALRICEQALDPQHPDLATTLTNLAKLYTKQRRYAQAEPLYQQALAIREQTLGPDHPYTATTLHQLAWLYQEQGKHGQAEPLYQRALVIRERVLGLEHSDTVTTRHNLARLYRDRGKYEQAELLL